MMSITYWSKILKADLLDQYVHFCFSIAAKPLRLFHLHTS